MKKEKIFNIIVIVSLSLFLINIYTGSETSMSVLSDKFVKESLSEDMIKNYFSTNSDVRKQAEDNIKRIVIRDLDYEDWMEYIEYTNILVYPLDAVGDRKEDIVVAVNLSKNTGIIAIYTKENEKYTIDNKIENLANIKNISVKRSDNSDKRFLKIEEFQDESVGAYFTDNFVGIYTEVDNKFIEVFRQSIKYEAFYNEKWIDSSIQNPKWCKLIEDSKVDYISDFDKKISLIVYKNISKSEGTTNSVKEVPSKFKKINEETFELKYTWSQKYNYFIIEEGKLKQNGEDVGIIEDSSKNVDHLLKLGDKYYKVINKNKEIRYVKEEEIDIK